MKIHHIGISVTNLKKSINFYSLLGFNLEKEFTKPEWDGNAAILSLNSFKLELFCFKDNIPSRDNAKNLHQLGLKHIGFSITDIWKTYNFLKEKGIEIDEPQKGTTCAWYCFFKDPDGIVLELYESKK
jgi:glyoxylase I family protein